VRGVCTPPVALNKIIKNDVLYGPSSTGYNHYRGMPDKKNKCCFHGSMHAEVHAMSRLRTKKTRPKNKKLQKMTMLVIRINYSGELRNSHPCYQCVKAMHDLQFNGVYKIVNVMYSVNGGIMCERLDNIIQRMRSDRKMIHFSISSRSSSGTFGINKKTLLFFIQDKKEMNEYIKKISI